MKILFDENFPKSVADTVEACGYEVVPFDDVLDCGADDETVFSAAQEVGAAILTSDRDFYHTVPLLHPHHAGIIVIALRQPSRQAISTRLNWFFANFSAPFADKVFILRDFSCRLKLPRENPR